MDYIVGVDIGTQSTKALLCAADGRIVAQDSVAYQPDTPRPPWAEQDPAIWLDTVVCTIAGAVTKARAEDGGAFAIYKGLYPALRSSMHGLHAVSGTARGSTT